MCNRISTTPVTTPSIRHLAMVSPNTRSDSLNQAPAAVCRPRRTKRRGTSAVEFAIVAPLFFMMVFGMIEVGRMVMVQQIITNAAREGARVAVVDGATSTGVTTAVNNYLTGAGISGATITTDPSDPNAASYGDPITVTVQLPFSRVTWLPSPWFISGSTQMVAKSVMRRETVE